MSARRNESTARLAKGFTLHAAQDSSTDVGTKPAGPWNRLANGCQRPRRGQLLAAASIAAPPTAPPPTPAGASHPPPPRRAAVRTLGLLVVLQGAFTDSARCPALSALSSTSGCVEAHVSAVGVAALSPVPASAGSRGPPGHAAAARTLGAECQRAAASIATSTSAISTAANYASNSA